MQVSGLGLGLGFCLAIAMALFCVCLDTVLVSCLLLGGTLLSHVILVIFHIISANEMGDFDYYLLS